MFEFTPITAEMEAKKKSNDLHTLPLARKKKILFSLSLMTMKSRKVGRKESKRDVY